MIIIQVTVKMDQKVTTDQFTKHSITLLSINILVKSNNFCCITATSYAAMTKKNHKKNANHQATLTATATHDDQAPPATGILHR